MGKIVKYCAGCEESFAEKFAFCPNCAQPLTAFEMNPVVSGGNTVIGKKAGQTVLGNNKPPEDEAVLEVPAAAPIIAETIFIKPLVPEIAPEVAAPTVSETEIAADSNKTQSFTLGDVEKSNKTQSFTLADVEELESLKEEKAEDDFTPETKTFAAAAGANSGSKCAANDLRSNLNAAKKSDDDGGYHITVIEEKNSKQRNGLLLGTLVIMVVVALGGTVYSLFTKDVGVGAIEGDDLFAFVPAVTDETPMELDEPPPQPDPGKGGGGGGGGRKDDAPISKGELPPQFKDKPLLTPSKEDISVTKPELAVIRATRGPNDIIPKTRSSTNGDPNSKNTTPSNGLSADNSGMGQNGSGGIGNNGRDGVGANGTGGIGLSTGNRYGNEPGTGGNSTAPKPPPPPDPKPIGPTEAIKFLSKPQPRYTDAARQNNVTGTVTLKVTFTASGQIGSVSPVSGLPYGLTEQAIAAAKSIRFEPPKRNGVPYSISKTITYNFTIY